MGLLDRAIKNGISKGISDAVGKAVEKAVNPAAERFAGKAAEQIDEASAAFDASAHAAAEAAEGAQAAQKAGGFAALETALSGWAKNAEQYATEAAKNMKLCPVCETPATADQKFCPKCGAKLPEETLGQGTLCPKCGRQNIIGTSFCAECGTKLPAAEAEEKAALEKWAELLPQYPVWNCGGTAYELEQGDGYFRFSAVLANEAAGQKAVEQYRETLKQAGFRQAGQNPCKEHLYQKIGGSCYHVDTEHCFEGSMEKPDIFFNMEEPTGGFDYVKPEPQQKGFGLGDLKDGFGDIKEGLGGLKGLFKR